ncbi:Uncharacterised protein [Mycobacteroides abscessus subsp. abscessus]|nr:Uncharacterised protein [Mycobacteroides abscessus subsp. abscessus]
MFMRTGSSPSDAPMAGSAVAITVASSICMKSAQPTISGTTIGDTRAPIR